MDPIEVGDRVRLILDKEVGPDNRWHGRTGTVTRIVADAAGEVTGDPVDSLLFEVELDSGETPNLHFRYADLVRMEDHAAALRDGADD